MRRVSSLALLPAPLPGFQARDSIVGDVEECLSVLVDRCGDALDDVAGFARGVAFWRKHGAKVGGGAAVAASSSSAGALSAVNLSLQSGASVASSASAFARRRRNGGVERVKAARHTKTVQRDLMKVVHHAVEADLIASVSIPSGVRLRACARDRAYLWLTVHPVEAAVRLADGEFRSAMRHMYGLSPITRDWHCRCGATVAAGHFHSCNRVHGPATYARHETVVSELGSFAVSQLQLHVERAPVMATVGGALFEGQRRVVPDVVFRGTDLHLAIDVSFVYSETEARTRVLRPSANAKEVYQIVRSAMAERARVKVGKYRAACARDGLEFKAFVADSHGALDKSAAAVVDQLSAYGARELGADKDDLERYLRRRVAIAIQRGNARLDRQAMAMSRNSYGAAVAMGLVLPRPGSVGGARDQ